MGSSQLHFVSCSVTFARDPQRRSHPLPGEICQPAGSSGCGSRPPAALAALQLPIGPVPPPRCIRFPFTEPRSTLWALKTCRRGAGDPQQPQTCPLFGSIPLWFSLPRATDGTVMGRTGLGSSEAPSGGPISEEVVGGASPSPQAASTDLTPSLLDLVGGSSGVGGPGLLEGEG